MSSYNARSLPPFKSSTCISVEILAMCLVLREIFCFVRVEWVEALNAAYCCFKTLLLCELLLITVTCYFFSLFFYIGSSNFIMSKSLIRILPLIKKIYNTLLKKEEVVQERVRLALSAWACRETGRTYKGLGVAKLLEVLFWKGFLSLFRLREQLHVALAVLLHLYFPLLFCLFYH